MNTEQDFSEDKTRPINVASVVDEFDPCAPQATQTDTEAAEEKATETSAKNATAATAPYDDYLPTIALGDKKEASEEVNKAQAIPIKEEIEERLNSSNTSDTLTRDLLVTNAVTRDENITVQVDTSEEFRSHLEIQGNRYRIQKMIGRGGYSKVFLAEDRVLGRRAVIKSLDEKCLNNAENVRKFIAEAKLGAQLYHHAIPAIYSLQTDSRNGLHLAMEFANGITMHDYIKQTREEMMKKRVSPKRCRELLMERLEIFLRVCDAISYCHSRGVIHCDLKPENIMIAKFGEIFIMDWGIAEFNGGGTGHVSGTPAYLAPERAQANPVSPLTDVFSLGMILNELVYLRKPLLADDYHVVLERVRNGQFEPSTPVVACQPWDKTLSAIIEKARNVDARKRYSSVAKLAKDLRSYIFNEEVSARPDNVVRKIGRWFSRNRTLTLGIFAGLVLLTLVISSIGIIGGIKIANEQKLNSERTVKMYGLNGQTADEVASRVHFVQERLLNIKNNYDAVAYQKYTGAGGVATHAPVYMDSDCLRGSGHRPNGLVNVSFFNSPVTLDTCTFYAVDSGVTQKDIQWAADLIYPMHDWMRATIYSNMTVASDGTASLNEQKMRYMANGSNLRRIVFRFNNGVIAAFPGKFEKKKETKRPVSIARHNASGFTWSSPYADSLRHVVQYCRCELNNPLGKSIGSVSFVVMLSEVVKPIQTMAGKFGGKVRYDLINSRDLLIFTTEKAYLNPDGTRGSDFVSKAKSYSYPEIAERIRNAGSADSGQFELKLNGARHLICWKKIPGAEWVLIQKISTADLAAVDGI